MNRVLFPAMASTLSARGILGSDLRHDLLTAQLMLAEPAAIPDLTTIVAGLQDEGDRRLIRDGIPPDRRRIEIAADARYRGQAYEITTPWDVETVDEMALERLTDAFHALHQQRYAHSSPGEAVEIVAVRARALGLFDPVRATGDASPEPAEATSRLAWTGGDWADVPCHPRTSISTALQGPLIVEEAYASLWIAPGWTVRPLGLDLVATREDAR